MIGDQCVLCDGKPKKHTSTFEGDHFFCAKCGQFVTERFLTIDPTYFESRHLLSGYTREYWEVSGKRDYVRLQASNLEEILAQCPQTPKEKADKLLLAIQRNTEFFGQNVAFQMESDYSLAYAKNSTEYLALTSYLVQRKFIDQVHDIPKGYLLKITVDGCEAIESRFLSPAITVFISSTCYDLIDLRAELADFLEPKGFIVKVSDDPYRMDVEPTEDSIQTCLRNVETADVVICIIDGRYGPPLPPEKKMSATHAEIRHAREREIPTYIFARDKALSDYDQLRKDENATTLRVEKNDPEQRMRWLEFTKELQELASAQKQRHSNWVDPFRDSVQLKKLVLKRLSEFRQRQEIIGNTSDDKD